MHGADALLGFPTSAPRSATRRGQSTRYKKACCLETMEVDSCLQAILAQLNPYEMELFPADMSDARRQLSKGYLNERFNQWSASDSYLACSPQINNLSALTGIKPT